jgi:hypothetical protein
MATALCNLCKRFGKDGRTCTAFARGIPREILQDGFDHRKHFPGDFGTLFEPASDRDREKVAEWEIQNNRTKTL